MLGTGDAVDGAGGVLPLLVCVLVVVIVVIIFGASISMQRRGEIGGTKQNTLG